MGAALQNKLNTSIVQMSHAYTSHPENKPKQARKVANTPYIPGNFTSNIIIEQV